MRRRGEQQRHAAEQHSGGKAQRRGKRDKADHFAHSRAPFESAEAGLGAVARFPARHGEGATPINSGKVLTPPPRHCVFGYSRPRCPAASPSSKTTRPSAPTTPKPCASTASR